MQVLLETVYRQGYQAAGGEEPHKEDLVALNAVILTNTARRLIALTKRVIACRVRMVTEVFEKVCRKKMGLEPDTVLDAVEAYEVLSWLDLDALDNTGADIEGLELEELDSIKDSIEKDLQEDRETMEKIYAAFWDRAMGEP